MVTGARTAAPTAPVARVLPLLPLPHLDREFDYLVPEEFDGTARPGVRVRVRFAGRLVDGFLLGRTDASEHTGKLGWLERVVSGEQVLTDEIADLAERVAARYAGTRADVLRLAIPPRHARVESDAPPEPAVVDESAVDATPWGRYRHGDAFVDAVRSGRGPRAVWQATPGEDWPRRLAELAALASTDGRSAVIVVPDQKDLDRVVAAASDVVGAGGVVGLAAGLGPSARYRRWLAALRGTARIVVGPRSAVFAPVPILGLLAVWDDGDESHAEPRAPYPHSREVAALRAYASGCALVVGGHARTAESQLLVETGWAHDLVAPRETVRHEMPAVTALADSERALARDPLARAARLPAIAFAAARAALERDEPVLVQVPRRGYVPSLACARCRTPARCRRCNGPLELPDTADADGAASPTCRWCGTADAGYRCGTCGGRALRAVVVGAGRTAEELGRAFAGVPVRTSGGDAVLADVPGGASLVVATVGAEPYAPDGYGAALLLDGWALLGRPDLRAAEETLRRWTAAAALVRPGRDGGSVVVVADSSIPTVQALVRWDPVGHAAGQLAERVEVGFPPAVHLAAIDGTAAAIADMLEASELPEGTERLGPVPLPAGARRPFAGDDADPADVERMLLRIPRGGGRALAAALRAAQAVRGARKAAHPARVQIDPLHIG
ncbi:primosomal protein N' [Rhodococcus rhodnii]|uniref:Probable replication restart protein PriA n=1 Tax=Rhodococcus rhodnii TaxID=38312 RepID=A0A6P2CH94_9NOCA|nr:primosomal protein N' [Rhodococcus rhodnii]TXG91091.1 primosomal protein N' [Rhodococcus rhodnii]